MTGDQRSLFDGYLSDGSLTASGLYGAFAEVYFDGAYIYYAVPEPSSLALVAAGCIGIAASRRRRCSGSLLATGEAICS